ncbi:MAG TPA: hypothetical protein VJ464_13430 [Blastocatellia bacterium]|nr:hypothetical protein [Blastocatellia bacterium]
MLKQILERLGVKDYSELKEQERQVYLQWAEILNKPDFTIDDLKKFLPIELARANEELRHWENSDKKELYYKAYARILQMLTDFLTAPEKERKALEGQLKQKYNL